MFDARTHDRQIRLEVEFKYAQWLLDIGRGCGNRHQRQHDVAFANVIFDPFTINRDIALEKMETRVIEQIGNPVGLHVHAINLPFGSIYDALGEMVADEAVDAKNQYFFHVIKRDYTW